MIGSAIARPLVVRETGSADSPRPRLLDRVRAALHARHYSRRTKEAYVAWIRRFIFFHAKRHPAEMGTPEVTRFLTSLAVDGHVAASTQPGFASSNAAGFGSRISISRRTRSLSAPGKVTRIE